MKTYKTYTLIAAVYATEADDLLRELADDPRVRSITLELGAGKYRVPDPARDDGESEA